MLLFYPNAIWNLDAYFAKLIARWIHGIQFTPRITQNWFLNWLKDKATGVQVCVCALCVLFCELADSLTFTLDAAVVLMFYSYLPFTFKLYIEPPSVCFILVTNFRFSSILNPCSYLNSYDYYCWILFVLLFFCIIFSLPRVVTFLRCTVGVVELVVFCFLCLHTWRLFWSFTFSYLQIVERESFNICLISRTYVK